MADKVIVNMSRKDLKKVMEKMLGVASVDVVMWADKNGLEPDGLTAKIAESCHRWLDALTFIPMKEKIWAVTGASEELYNMPEPDRQKIIDEGKETIDKTDRFKKMLDELN